MTETLKERNDREYEAWKAQRTTRVAIAAQVSCPTCKAPKGEPCIWGVTNNGGSHTARYRKVGV